MTYKRKRDGATKQVSFFFSLCFWYTNNSCVQARRNSFVWLYVLITRFCWIY